MQARSPNLRDTRTILHRLAYRAGQGVLIYWALSAIFGAAAELPSRIEFVLTGGFALLMLILPRPDGPPEVRGQRTGWNRLLLNPLRFLT